MHDMAEVFLEKRVYAQDRVLLTLSLHDIAHNKGPGVAAILEVAGVDCLFTNFVEDFSALSPLWNNPRRSRGFRTADILVFVVLLGSPDNAVLHHVSHHLLDFAFRQRDTDHQAFAIG